MEACQYVHFVATNQEYIIPKKSLFNRIIGDSHFELQFAAFLEECDDVISYSKNYLAAKRTYRLTLG
jgi:type III restriction enzyme